MNDKKKVWFGAGCVIIALSICGCVDANRLRTESFEITKEVEEHVVTVIPVKQLPINKPTQRPYPDFDLKNLSVIGKEGQINDSSRVESVRESAEDNRSGEGSESIDEGFNESGSGDEPINDSDSGYSVEVEGITGGSSTSDIEQDYSGESVSELVESGSDYGAETESSGNEGYSFEADTQDSGEPEGLTYLGTWTTTAYCPCEICCGEWATGCTASGVLATPNHTVACGSLPFGTQVMIDGMIYTVEDTGVEGEWIDIFFNSHEEALVYGMQMKEVYLVE